MEPLSLEEVASRAGVEVESVRRLAGLGALEGRWDEYGERAVHRVALLDAWEAAGLPPESILEDARLRFVRVGPASLEGIARPVTLYRMLRPESS
jgi:hypothetical protein